MMCRFAKGLAVVSMLGLVGCGGDEKPGTPEGGGDADTQAPTPGPGDGPEGGGEEEGGPGHGEHHQHQQRLGETLLRRGVADLLLLLLLLFGLVAALGGEGRSRRWTRAQAGLALEGGGDQVAAEEHGTAEYE